MSNPANAISTMLQPSLQQQLDANASVNLHHDLISNMVSLSREAQQEQNAAVSANFEQMWGICKQLEKQIEEKTGALDRQLDDTRDLMRKENMIMGSKLQQSEEKQTETLMSVFDKLKEQLHLLEKQTKEDIAVAKQANTNHALDLHKEINERHDAHASDLQAQISTLRKDFEEAVRVKALENTVQKLLLELRDVNGRIAQQEQTHKDFATKTNSAVANLQEQITQQVNKNLEDLAQKQILFENQFLQFQKKHDYQLTTMEGNWKNAVESLHKVLSFLCSTLYFWLHSG